MSNYQGKSRTQGKSFKKGGRGPGGFSKASLPPAPKVALTVRVQGTGIPTLHRRIAEGCVAAAAALLRAHTGSLVIELGTDGSADVIGAAARADLEARVLRIDPRPLERAMSGRLRALDGGVDPAETTMLYVAQCVAGAVSLIRLPVSSMCPQRLAAIIALATLAPCRVAGPNASDVIRFGGVDVTPAEVFAARALLPGGLAGLVLRLEEWYEERNLAPAPQEQPSSTLAA